MSQSIKKGKPPHKTTVEADGIKNLDIMGERFKLGYSKTTKRFKTNLGGCVSLMITILSVGALIFFFLNTLIPAPQWSPPPQSFRHQLRASTSTTRIFYPGSQFYRAASMSP